MFGSNDDKKTPAEPGEKKGLFGWLRKKPQPAPAEQPAAEQPDSESVEQTGASSNRLSRHLRKSNRRAWSRPICNRLRT